MTVLPIETVLTEYLASQKEPIKVVVITDFESMSREQYVELNKCCRANKVAMISAS